MTTPAEDRCCACLPKSGLPHLADLRNHREVCVQVVEDRAWLWWPAGEDGVLHRVLAVAGVELFTRRGGLWYRPGQRLPSFHVPSEERAQPLLAVLTPAPVRTEDSWPDLFQPLPLGLVRDDRPRAATALLCRMAELAHWADHATTMQLASLLAAQCDGEVLLLGPKLPVLRESKRFWGRSVLIPLGFRTEPALAESALREALGLQGEEIGLLTNAGVEVISRTVFAPLTRAGVRLAVRECV
jgi:hypothetical protein